MIDFSYKFQTYLLKKKYHTLSKISCMINVSLMRVFIPFYYKITPSKRPGVHTNSREQKVIISLTSFPPRINRIWMVLESLLRQTVKPDKIILWLAETQFRDLNDLPRKILKLQNRGLEIKFCEDLKSHKKYYYTMKNHPDDIVITVDDDIFYPENMVKHILEKHCEYPEAIVCYRAHMITYKNKEVREYSKWDSGSPNVSGPDINLMPTGCGGVLYPPNSLNPEVFNINSIKSLAFFADDIWLKCMSYIEGTQVVKVFPIYSPMFSTFGSDKSGLANKNILEGHNDVQLKNVVKKYAIEFNKQ